MITTVSRRWRAVRKNDAGLTLIELMAVMTIALVLIGVASSMFLAADRVQAGDRTRESNTMDAGLSLQATAKYLRSATALCVRTDPKTVPCDSSKAAILPAQAGTVRADSGDFTFFSSVGNTATFTQGAGVQGSGTFSGYTLPGPLKIRLYVDGSKRLQAALYMPTVNSATGLCCLYPASPTSTLTLAGNVVTKNQAGTAAGQDGAPFAFYSGTQLLQTPLSLTDALRVDHVRVDVKVAGPSSPSVGGSEFVDTILFANYKSDSDLRQ